MGVSSDQFQWNALETVDGQWTPPTEDDRQIERDAMRAKRVSTYGGP
ncbi:hypothetical protein AB7C87_00575 [Natrarchaeobius sp. A-rgal3]